jgi:hypothetical protein
MRSGKQASFTAAHACATVKEEEARMKKVNTGRLIKLGSVHRLTKAIGPGTRPELNPVFAWQG